VGFLGDDNDTHPQPLFRIGRFLTGKRMLTNQTFRKLFKAETIEVGTGLQIKSLAVLFTDLQASTAMYERVGDLKALDIVRRHFAVLEGVVAAQRGAVVKTIGDAVMAVFPEPDRALAAAAEMIANVRQAVAYGEDLVLKIGVHCGPCVAIQSNNQVDYFGRTVTIAARVQGLAEGGEIVCTEDVWSQPGVQDLVAERGFFSRPEQPLLKGIADRFAVRRIVVAAAPPLARGKRRAKPDAPPKRHRKAAGRATVRVAAHRARHSGAKGKRAKQRRL
jgi:class 3 adenylate cyclase